MDVIYLDFAKAFDTVERGLARFAIVISFETCISGKFFIVLSNEFSFKVHAGGVLKNYRKYFGKQVLY